MKRTKHLGELEQLVLMAALRLKDGAYGASVMRELRDRVGRELAPGAIFATVDRLERKGYLTSALGETTPGRGGKPKRYITVTPEGILALQKARETWAVLAEGLEEILGR